MTASGFNEFGRLLMFDAVSITDSGLQGFGFYDPFRQAIRFFRMHGLSQSQMG